MRIVNTEVIRNKKVLVRLDLDIPFTDNGEIADSTRIDAATATFDLLKQSATQVVFCGHMGRPKGQVDESLSTKRLLPLLEERLGESVSFHADLDQPQVTKKYVLLENLRFYPGEEEDSEAFGKTLAAFGEVFVFEAFGVAHRESASTSGITKILPSYAGLHVAKEVVELSNVVHDPIKPFIIVLGGSKIETKLPVIYHLEDHAEAILIGGLLAKEIKDQNLTMPANCVVADLREDGLDIAEESMNRFTNILSKAQTIVWNGPVGKFEDEDASQGTKEIASAVVNSGAYSVIGGGDTLAALHTFGLLDQIDFVSVGGGAMLEFLAGKQLPALAALE